MKPLKTPPQTATGQPQDFSGIAGIRRVSDDLHAASPWLLTLYHSGKRSRTYHKTQDDAVKAKAGADRLKKREGSRALGFDRAAQVEYDAAKRIAGDRSLAEIASLFANRGESKTVGEAVEAYIKAKESLGRSHRHLKDLRSRLRTFSRSYPERDTASITRNEITDWLTSLPLAPRTVWNYFGAIEALFNFAERRSWVETNPVRKIDRDTDLPAKPKGAVQILTHAQAEALMRHIESERPWLVGWACLQYFLGVRDAEAERMRGEWIDRKRRRIVLPASITKTGDDWVMDAIPPVFWKWVDAYPKAFAGAISYPSNREWGQIRDALFTHWPANGFRHTFATMHLSAYRDQSATSLLLRHQNARRLWRNYLRHLVPKAQGLRYLNLSPASGKP